MVVSAPPKDSPVYKYYEQTEEVLMLASRLFGDRAAALSWLIQPNDYFFNDSPQTVIYKNEFELVRDLLLERLGEKEGFAF